MKAMDLVFLRFQSAILFIIQFIDSGDIDRYRISFSFCMKTTVFVFLKKYAVCLAISAVSASVARQETPKEIIRTPG